MTKSSNIIYNLIKTISQSCNSKTSPPLNLEIMLYIQPTLVIKTYPNVTLSVL